MEFYFGLDCLFFRKLSRSFGGSLKDIKISSNVASTTRPEPVTNELTEGEEERRESWCEGRKMVKDSLIRAERRERQLLLRIGSVRDTIPLIFDSAGPTGTTGHRRTYTHARSSYELVKPVILHALVSFAFILRTNWYFTILSQRAVNFTGTTHI